MATQPTSGLVPAASFQPQLILRRNGLHPTATILRIFGTLRKGSRFCLRGPINRRSPSWRPQIAILYNNDGVNRTVYTRESNSTGWFVGIIVALALLAIAYLVFSANTQPSTTNLDVNTPPATTTVVPPADTNTTPMAPATPPASTAPATPDTTAPATTTPDVTAPATSAAPTESAPATSP
jgi:preprotein translocase subunit SecG